VIVPDVNDTLGYVFDAIEMTLEKLDNEIPLIGFAGSPWTIFCYCIEGRGSKDFNIAKSFVFYNRKRRTNYYKKLQILRLLT
jgi:uroporphyrinogen decarboxylase